MLLLLMILLFFKNGNCETVKPDRRIYRGYPDVDNRFPYVVCIEQQLDLSYLRLCSGILIDENWILTAGHCIRENLNLTVTYRNRSKRNNVERVDILLQIRHPNFQILNWPTINLNLTILNDIGLLKVEKVHIGTFAQLCSENFKIFVGSSVVFAGYGNTWNKSEASTIAEWKDKKLKFNDSPLLLGEGVVSECTIRTPEQLSICVYSPVSSTRKGDSGGPLLLDGKVIGVHSGKLKDDMKFVPVSPYLSWIQEMKSKPQDLRIMSHK